MVQPRGAADLLRAYYHALDVPDLAQLDDIFGEQSLWEFPGQHLRGVAAITRSLQRSLDTGLRMNHDIRHLLEHGSVAICELLATNMLGDQTFVVAGAVVCEATNGTVTRITAYPDAAQMAPFMTALLAPRG